MGVSWVAWRFSFSLSRTQGDYTNGEDRAHPRQVKQEVTAGGRSPGASSVSSLRRLCFEKQV